jgi:hypothetical protein
MHSEGGGFCCSDFVELLPELHAWPVCSVWESLRPLKIQNFESKCRIKLALCKISPRDPPTKYHVV